ncbi:MAG: questin oxidase family protein [Bdellovibrionota bacterium]
MIKLNINRHLAYLTEWKASQDSLFQENIRVPFDLDLKSLADAAIQVFLSCPSFACIHLVTSTHALRHVIPFVGQTNDTLKHFWLAFAAVFVSEGAPNMKTPIVTKSRSWGELSKQAIESENDHWCKFVYTCMEEEKHYKSPFYLQAANC